MTAISKYVRSVQLRLLCIDSLVSRKSELYPYFQFVRAPGCGDYDTFKKDYCKGGNGNSEKLTRALNSWMHRKTHKDTIFGKKLVDLPMMNQEVIELEFNAVERLVYNRFMERFKERIRG